MKTSAFASRMTLLAGLLAAVLTMTLFAQRPAAQGGPIEEPAGTSAITLKMENYVAGLDRPVGIANAGDMRLFVLEQAGQIRIVNPDGTLQATPFLDIRDRVASLGPEQGLLGLAFHPRYFANGYFYVNYTNETGGFIRTRISRFTVTADPGVANPASEQILLTVDQPFRNHNAGRINFGPDGYLYIPLGDGGSGGDPGNRAQNNSLLLGKISRIDVDGLAGSPSDCKGLGQGTYTIPADNPFVDGPNHQPVNNCDEIWANGLRNPWQANFDARTGDLFIADVGQSTVEEVNFQPRSSGGGENYGWRCYEGSLAYNTSGCASPDNYTFPVFEYQRPSGYGDCSVTGGYVYRGLRYHALYGRYLLTDYCSGRFWDLQQQPNGSWQATTHLDVFPQDATTTFGNASFGQRCDGELFVANVYQGKIFYLTGFASPDVAPLPTRSSQSVDAGYWAYFPLVSVSGCR
jgi:glucose/arabinose dehydrogenase